MKNIYRVCKNCKGIGTVQAAFYMGVLQYPMSPEIHFMDKDMKIETIECAACKGTGKVLWGWIEE